MSEFSKGAQRGLEGPRKSSFGEHKFLLFREKGKW
jgi:hypothetical protein